MTAAPMMKCGHAANGQWVDPETGDRKPACVICAGIQDGANMVVEDSPPDLTGRMATCTYFKKCGHQRPSTDERLAFFEHRPNRETDSYYCGCYGWN